MIEPDINERMARLAPSQAQPDVDPIAAEIAAQSMVPSSQPTMTQMPEIDPVAREIADASKQTLDAAVLGARSVNPDDAAKAIGLGRKIGIPAEVARADLSRAEQQAYLMDLRAKDFARTDPIMANFLANKEFAEVAHDDVGVLDAIRPIMQDWAMLYWTGATPNMRRGFERGQLVAERGDIGAKAMTGFAGPEDFDRAKQVELRLRELTDVGFLGATTEVIAQNLAQLRGIGTGAVAGAAVGSVVPVVGTVAGGALGATGGVITTTAQMEAGNLYLDLREQGVSDDAAIPTAIAGGYLNGIIEVVGMKIAAKPFQALAKRMLAESVAKAVAQPTVRAALATAGKGYLMQVGSEATEEALQEVVIIAGEEIAKAIDSVDTETSMAQAMDRVVDAFTQGAMGAAILGGIGPGSNLYVDMRRAATTQRQQDFFQRLSETSKESRLAQRSPDAYERFLEAQAKGGPAETIYVDARVAQQVFAQSGLTPQQLEEVLPGIRAQVETEVATGGDVTIQTARFGARLANTDLGNSLLPHMRLDPDAMSVTEAQEWNAKRQETVREAEQILAQKQEADGTFVSEARDIYNDVRRQAMEAGQDSDVADVAASLYQAFVVTQAAEQNMTPAQFQAAQGVRGIQGIIGEMAPAVAPMAPRMEIAPGVMAPARPAGMTSAAYERLILGEFEAPALLSAEVSTIQTQTDAASTAIDQSSIPAKAKDGLGISVKQIGTALRQGNAVELANALWKLRERMSKLDTVPAELQALAAGIQERLASLGITIEVPQVGAEDRGGQEVERVSVMPNKDSAQVFDRIKTVMAPVVRRNGAVISRGQVVVEAGAEAFEAQRAAALDVETQRVDAEINERMARVRQVAAAPGVMEQAAQFLPSGERRTDTPEFKAWSNNAQVIASERSEAHEFTTGKPVVVEALHGSTERGLRRFDVGRAVEVPGAIFFTSNPAVAEQYTYERAYGDIISDQPTGDVVRAYVAFANPMVYRPKGKVVDAIEMGRAIEQAKAAGHDGIIIKNIDDSIGMTGDMGDVYVTWNPTSIKSVDNRGTWSRETANIFEQAGTQPRLMAVHNLSADNLVFADRMGGLSVPSIGVITEERGGVEGFGEITLIGTREMADPATSRVFSSDAYSARFPRAEWPKVASAKANKFVDQLREVAARFEDRRIIDETFDAMVNSPDAEKVVGYWLRSMPVGALFLKEKGIEIAPIMRQRKTLSGLSWESIDKLRPVYEAVNQQVAYDEMENSPEYRNLQERYADAIRSEYAAVREDLGDATIERWATGFTPTTLQRLSRDMSQADRQTVDDTATRTAIDSAMEPFISEFKSWVEAKVRQQFGEPFIRIGRSRKPYTLGNIVDVMTSPKVRGEEKGMTFGAGAARAEAAVEFVDLEQMREAAKSAIVDPDEYSKASKKSEAQLAAYRDAVIEYTKLTDWRGKSDTWAALDGSMRALATYGTRKRKDAAAMRRALAKEGFASNRIPVEIIEQAMEAAEALFNAPVPYFESKPQRAVRLGEFAGAVIPSNATQETRDILDRNGVRYMTYLAGDEADRQRAVREMARSPEARGEVLFQSPVAPDFYSALDREVSIIDAKALTASGWGERFNGLISKGAIKADELEWSGLADYLKMQEGKVSKASVLDFLRGNGVQVERTYLGRADNIMDLRNAEARAEMEYDDALEAERAAQALDEAAWTAADAALTAARQRAVAAKMARQDAEQRSPAKYAKYTLPGGTNYREVLLTLPIDQERLRATQSKYNQLVESGVPLIEAMEQAQEEMAREFSSPHWEQPNVLVHLRLNDRVDAEGKRVLFVEELQSDWGQQGKKVGFDDPMERDAARAALPAEESRLEELTQAWNASRISDPERAASIYTEAEAQRGIVEKLQDVAFGPQKILRAPFVENTDGWLNLGLKQVLLEAVRGNYDRVAFVTGQQSADRYDLSKQVSRVVYQDNYGGGVGVNLEGPPSAGRIIAYDKQDRPVLNQPIENPAELENYVGKEVAQRLLDARPQAGNYAGLGARQRELSGLDLQVGGKGMVEFYDKIVPIAMGKLLKKYGGGKLDKIAIGTGEARVFSGSIVFPNSTATEDFLVGISADGLDEYEYSKTSPTRVTFANIPETVLDMFEYRAENNGGEVASAIGAPGVTQQQEQPSFAVTPEMVKKLESGLPLFQAAAAPGPRGGIDIRRMVIMLTKASDRTTLWHEFVHFFLHMYTEAAVSGRASERQLNDLDLLLKWFKIEGETPAERLAKWSAMTLDQKRKHHEALTYNAEIYAFEGKAPSAELIPVFERLRAFMLRVYKSIRDDLNAIYRREFGEDLPILTGEVREVMDRMLATDEQIRRQAAINEMKPMFQSQEQSGMDDAEWAAYQAMQQEAIEAAVTDMNKASLRQMQWLGNARSRILKDIQRKHDRQRKEVSAEVAAAVRIEPVYRAMTYLRTGRFIDADGTEVEVEGPHRLDTKRVKAIYETVPTAESLEPLRATGMPLPTVVQPNLAKLGTGSGGMMGLDGLDPDLVAETFGYSSGDQLIRALVAARPIKEEVAARTDAEMLRRFGDMNTPEAVEAEVQAALHNEARARFVAVELRYVARATEPVRVMLDAAKQVARDLIAGKRVRDVRPSDFVAAEARAARDATRIGAPTNPVAIGQAAQTRAYNEAIAAGTDPAEAMVAAIEAGAEAARMAQERSDALKAQYGAEPQQALIRAKRAQLYQNQLAAEALRVQEEVAKAVKYLRRVLRDENVKRMGAAAADQIAGLLERYEVAPVSLKRLDERRALVEWLAAQEAAGLVPDIAPEIANEARRVNYREVKVSEFRDLVDAVKQIEFIGKNERKLQLAEERAAFEETRDEIVTRIRAVAKVRGLDVDPRSPLTNIGRTAAALRGFAAQHLKAASVARILDGGKDDGPLWNAIIRTANAAADMETTMRAEASAKLAEILGPVFKLGNMGGKGIYFPSIDRALNREARIAIALNVGNDGNRQRLLDGEGWTIDQVQPILESLTEAEWQAVQQVWDYIDTYRPLIAEKERRLYGKTPEWVEAVPMTVRTADGKVVNLTGGYYPIKYDPVASDRVATIDEVAEAKRAMDGAYTAATTRRSFVKARAKEVVDRPLLYTLDAAFSGVNDVIHDLAWHEWLIGTNRLLRDTEFANAVRETRGPEFLKQLRDWAKDNAAGERKQQVAGEGALSWLRQNISASGLGFNVVSAIMQVTGFNQSIVRVGAKYVGRGIAQFAGSPIDTSRIVAEKSQFMAERGRTQFRELNEIKNRVRGQTEVARRVTAGTYFLMMNMQRTVDIPTWLGAYQKALDAGKDDARAVALADQAVRDSQGSGLISDLAAIERGGPMMKLFTVFYSYMNTVYNMTAVQTYTARGRGKLAADYVMLLVVPVVLGQAIKNLVQPDADDEEFDPEALARKLAAEELSYLMGTMVIAREFGGAAQLLTGAEGVRMGYGGPAGLRAVGEVYGLATQAGQLEFDRAFRRSAINTLGAFTGLPSAQINRTIDGIEAVVEGEVTGVGAVAAPFTGVQR